MTRRAAPADPALNSHGGCVFVTGGANATFVNVDIAGGQAPRGGGIAALDAGRILVTGSRFKRNIANTTGTEEVAVGGGLYTFNSPTEVDECEFRENWAECDGANSPVFYGDDDSQSILFGGAGVFIQESEAMSITRSIFSANTNNARGPLPANGGSIKIDYVDEMLVSDVVISDSLTLTETSYVGGLLTTRAGNNLVLRKITVVNNTAISGGAMIGFTLVTFDTLAISMFDIKITNNFGSSVDYFQGGGIRVSTAQYSAERITIANNTFASTSVIKGSAFFLGNCDTVSLTHFVIRNNTVRGGVSSTAVSSLPYVENPAAGQCGGSMTLNKLSGAITDGSGGANYPNLALCVWNLQPASVFVTRIVYKIVITQLDIEETADCTFDSVSIYDGLTTTSPLIGRYCGHSVANPTCGAGACPPITEITSSSNAVSIIFKSDEDVNYGGFALSWSSGRQGIADGSSFSSDEMALALQDISAGAGAFLLLCTNVVMRDWLVEGNSATHPLLAVGGGIYVTSSSVTMSETVIRNNSVSALIAGGGGLAVMDKSTVTIKGGVTIEHNEVKSEGECFTAMGTLLCGAGWGGGAVVHNSALVTAEDSRTLPIERNTANCDGSHCVAFGGGAAVVYHSRLVAMRNVTDDSNSVLLRKNQAPHGGGLHVGHSSTVDIVGLLCEANYAACFDPSSSSAHRRESLAQGCGWVGGGCIYTDSGSVVLSRSSIRDNVVSGIDGGGGGAVAMDGSSELSLTDSELRNNSAPEGAGLWGEGTAAAVCLRSNLTNNQADFVGGGVSVRGSMSLHMKDSRLIRNEAVRASAVWGYGEHARLVFENTASSDEAGVIAMVLGRVSEANATALSTNASSAGAAANSTLGMNWECTQPGSVMEAQEDQQFYSQTCVACTTGTYSIERGSTARKNRKCLVCPYGGQCDGASATSNGLRSLVGYWGLANEAGEVQFYGCPLPFCCPIGSGSCETYNHCEGGRVGPLCGQCPPGMGLRFLSDACGPDSTCNDRGWASAALIGISFAFAVRLVVTWGGRGSTGLDMVLLFFYQVAGLIKSTPWKYTSATSFAFVQSLFSFSPSGQTGGGGVCFAKGMTAKNKVAGRVVFPGVVFGAIGIIWLLHWAAYAAAEYMVHIRKRRRETRNQSSVQKPWYERVHDAGPPALGRYASAVVCFLSIAFITLSLTAVEMVQCFTMNGQLVWLWDAEVECYAAWQGGAFAMLVVLLPLPFVLMFLIIRHKPDAEVENHWWADVREMMGSGYRDKRHWWIGVSLIRRQLVVLLYSLTTNAIWRAMGLGILAVVFLVLNLAVKPFENRTAQHLESLSLFLLCCLALTTTPGLAQIELKSTAPVQNEGPLEWLQLIIFAMPGLLCGVPFVSAKLRELRAFLRGERHRSAVSAQDSPPSTEGVSPHADSNDMDFAGTLVSSVSWNLGDICIDIPESSSRFALELAPSDLSSGSSGKGAELGRPPFRTFLNSDVVTIPVIAFDFEIDEGGSAAGYSFA